jgi:hypothetical protein
VFIVFRNQQTWGRCLRKDLKTLLVIELILTEVLHLDHGDFNRGCYHNLLRRVTNLIDQELVSICIVVEINRPAQTSSVSQVRASIRSRVTYILCKSGLHFFGLLLNFFRQVRILSLQHGELKLRVHAFDRAIGNVAKIRDRECQKQSAHDVAQLELHSRIIRQCEHQQAYDAQVQTEFIKYLVNVLRWHDRWLGKPVVDLVSNIGEEEADHD